MSRVALSIPVTFSSSFDILTIVSWQHRHRETPVLSVKRPGKLRKHVKAKLKVESHPQIIHNLFNLNL